MIEFREELRARRLVEICLHLAASVCVADLRPSLPAPPSILSLRHAARPTADSTRKPKAT